MTQRVLIMRHASGLVNRARRLAIEKWPEARLEVHDLAAYGKPPADFRWDRYAHMLIDDEYLRREGLLWLSELRGKPNFPKIVRVPNEAARATSRPPRSRSRRRPCRRNAKSKTAPPRRTSSRSARMRRQAEPPAGAGRQPQHDRARGRAAPGRCGRGAPLGGHHRLHPGQAPRQRRHRQCLPVRTRPGQTTRGAQDPQGRRQRGFRPAVALRAGILRGLEHRQPVRRQGVRAWLHRQPRLHRHGILPGRRPARTHLA